MLPGAVMDILQPDFVVAMAGTLQVPLAVLTLVGVWKLLGIIALARPGWRRINEWAYTGFFFDLTGAMMVHAAAGDTAGVVPPAVFVGVLIASYLLRQRALGTKA